MMSNGEDALETFTEWKRRTYILGRNSLSHEPGTTAIKEFVKRLVYFGKARSPQILAP